MFVGVQKNLKYEILSLEKFFKKLENAGETLPFWGRGNEPVSRPIYEGRGGREEKKPSQPLKKKLNSILKSTRF
jgi:hypothetical protein